MFLERRNSRTQRTQRERGGVFSERSCVLERGVVFSERRCVLRTQCSQNAGISRTQSFQHARPAGQLASQPATLNLERSENATRTQRERKFTSPSGNFVPSAAPPPIRQPPLAAAKHTVCSRTRCVLRTQSCVLRTQRCVLERGVF